MSRKSDIRLIHPLLERMSECQNRNKTPEGKWLEAGSHERQSSAIQTPHDIRASYRSWQT